MSQITKYENISYTIAHNPDAGEDVKISAADTTILFIPLSHLPRAFVLGPVLLPLSPFPLKK